ncbi:MAG: oxygenase MpaB family protein [Cellvibrionaceae bacterium]
MTKPVSPLPREPGRAPGHGSILWDTFSDVTLAPFSIPILVMQAAHPDVGAAVAQYSVYKKEPWGRLFRTGFSLMRFLYGGKQGRQSQTEAKNLRALHAHIKGSRPDGTQYHALTPATFRVVPDTFLAAVIRFREEMKDPLDAAKKEQVFEEYIQLCLLFHIPRSSLEKNLEEFEAYFDNLLFNTMNYNETVAFLLEDMMKYGPRIPYLPMPKSWWQWIYRRTFYPLIRLFTLGFLDPRFRTLHDIPWSESDAKYYQRLVTIVRTIRRVTPRWLRYSPFSLYIMLGGHGPEAMTFERLAKLIKR